MTGKRIVITEAKKLELFEKAYKLEEMGNDKWLDSCSFDGSITLKQASYYEAEGALGMLDILGLLGEYIRWANKRLHEFEIERSDEDE